MTEPKMKASVIACVIAGTVVLAAAADDPPLTLELKDFAPAPITGRVDGTGQTDGMLARITSLREEPGGANRFFINDLNGPLYIVDKATKTFKTYIDFNGREGHAGVFHKLAWETGYAGGLITIQFDPDYRANGKFYTIHTEDPALPGSNIPDNANLPGLNHGEHGSVRGHQQVDARFGEVGRRLLDVAVGHARHRQVLDLGERRQDQVGIARRGRHVERIGFRTR